jgi:Ca-activated chloride channel homolog
MESNCNRWLANGVLGAAALMVAGAAQAAVVSSWSAPVNGSSFNVGSAISLTGNANASGIVGGTGLDLALVLDSSGSMSTTVSGKTRNQWLKEASVALVNALPQETSSVTVVEFDSNAVTLRQLTSLSTGKAQVISAINSLDASGSTNIPAGIDRGTLELTGSLATPSRAQMMVVVSDGATLGNPATSAANALLAGVEAVHSVGIPGHVPSTMQAIATAGNGIYTDGSNLTNLINLFNGTGGNLVGIDHLDILMNDGSFLAGYAIDGLGNFSLNAVMLPGVNTFVATAYDTLGNSAAAVLTLYGINAPVPEPATYALMGLGLALIGQMARRRKATFEG